MFACQFKFLNKIHRGCAITRSQSQGQLDCLKSHLQSTTKNNNCTNKCDDKTDFDQLNTDLQQVFDQFDNENGNNDTNVSDDETVSSNNFKKIPGKLLPQYHLESSRGAKKDRLTQHTLQSYFGGQ